tara:strand:- start:25341 stop:26783 length:1443 start_codon:yes stop_codon:yes gene_type:complete
MRSFFLILWIFLVGAGSLHAQEFIEIDFAKIIKSDVNQGSGAANLCWLLDSDKHNTGKEQSMYTALKEMGCGSLRFPYGHLADNYLWHTPPYENIDGGLRPKLASFSQAPAKWDWAVNSKGAFKNAMDFDEYMELCQQLEIKPLVVVNVFSYKYKNGPTFDDLIEVAVEWVKYAKKKNYKVAYWQIGNEVDHHAKLLSMAEYVDCYYKIAKAMKNEDPNIKVGPGVLSKVNYFKTIIENNPKSIDFISCHQYMWPYVKTCKNYELWKENKDDYLKNVKKMQNAVAKSSKPKLEILITETGVSPSNKGMGSSNNVYKALWYFELLMNEIHQPNVAYSYFWGTHSPWSGNKDNEKNDVAVLLRTDDNSRKPIAEVIKFVNDNITDELVNTTRVANYIRAYTSVNTKRDKCQLFLLNKNDTPQNISIELHQLPQGIHTFNRTELKGKHANDKTVELVKSEQVKIKDNKLELTLTPLSITLLKN